MNTLNLRALADDWGLNPRKWMAASVSELYRLPGERLQALQAQLVGESFDFHRAHNAWFRSQCEALGVDAGSVKTAADLVRIPLVPIGVFRSAASHVLLSKPMNQIEHEMRSVGTSGIPSMARRCRETVDASITALVGMYREFLGISHGAALYLSPSTEEMPEMGMVKALSLMSGVLDAQRHVVRGHRLDTDAGIAALQGWQGHFTRHIVGPPFLIQRFMNQLQARGLSLPLDPRSHVVTLGGWKRPNSDTITRATFDAQCAQTLGIQPGQVRDLYAVVESNAMAIEDEHGQKCVSPYSVFSVRDLADSRLEVELGQHGQLAILDPLARSTPGFILTDDVVRLVPARGQRSGQCVEYLARAPSAREFGCCAVKLDAEMADGSDGPSTDGGSCAVAV